MREIYLSHWESHLFCRRSIVGHEPMKVKGGDVVRFSNLAAGEYYVEVIFESAPVNSGETLESDLNISVYSS